MVWVSIVANYLKTLNLFRLKIGLYFGSFNPIHIGHLIIANYMAENGGVDSVWLVVTPHNPHKAKKSLASNYDRLQLVNLAIEGNMKLKASDIEFNLPQPSYTIDTMTYLLEKYPQHEFCLIMGGDNLANLHKWKNYEKLLCQFPIHVYKRSEQDLGALAQHPNVTFHEAALLQISSSYIRRLIKERKSIRYLVSEPVYDYLENSTMYTSL